MSTKKQSTTTNKKSPASSTQKTTNKNAKTTVNTTTTTANNNNKNTSKTNTVLNTQGSFQGSNNSISNNNNNTTSKAQAQQPLQPVNKPPNMTGTSYFSTSSVIINKEQIKTLNTREYIQATVMQDVSEGMYLIAKDKPNNPIEYLGKYLLEQSKLKEK